MKESVESRVARVKMTVNHKDDKALLNGQLTRVARAVIKRSKEPAVPPNR